jgi:PAS domain-containing protein
MGVRSAAATSGASGPMTHGSVRPSLLTIPASDEAFRRHVTAQLAGSGAERPEELEARLRRLFPRALVRERGLSGEGPTWYVYRDGRWQPETSAPWWTAAGLPSLRVSLDGWVTDASAAAASLLGIEPSDRGLRHYTDFVLPGTIADATHLFAIVAAGEILEGTVLLRQATGEPIAVDLRAEGDSTEVVAVFRLAEGVESDVAVDARPIPTYRCYPTTDVAFARYAALALGRMPEPSPEGLELRLRRLYPHARVDGGPDGWTVRREQAADVATDGGAWWTDATLPRVTYDAQALIVSANDAATALLGRALVGHHWQEFVTPGTTEQVSGMLSILAEAGAAESRFRMPRQDGVLVEFDSYTEVHGERFTTTMRPRPND